MKVAFCTIAEKSTMYFSLVEEFKKNGHDVTIIAPVYNQKTTFNIKDNINYLFFKSRALLNTGIIKRGIANLLFPYVSLSAVKKYLSNEQFDLIILTTPPLGFYNVIAFLKNKNKNSKFYIILRDIHPEGAKLVGLHKIWPLFAYFRRVEINLYNLADYIGCMSPKNIDFILKLNTKLEATKLTLLPNWEPFVEYRPVKIGFDKKNDLENKFIVVFGGNMGITQNLDILLELALEKKKLEDVIFLFIGTGTEKERLKLKAKEMKLTNTIFKDQISRDNFNELMKICSLGFISLSPKVYIPNYPSKSLGYMVSKLPILASLDAITDYGEDLLDKYNCGLWSLATDFDKLSKNFDILYYNKELRLQMGENGYEALKKFTPQITYEKIMKTYKDGNSNI